MLNNTKYIYAKYSNFSISFQVLQYTCSKCSQSTTRINKVISLISSMNQITASKLTKLTRIHRYQLSIKFKAQEIFYDMNYDLKILCVTRKIEI